MAARKSYPSITLVTPQTEKPYVQLPRAALYGQGPFAELPPYLLLTWCRLFAAKPGKYQNRTHLCRWIGADWNSVRKQVKALQDLGLLIITEDSWEVVAPKIEDKGIPGPEQQEQPKTESQKKEREERREQPQQPATRTERVPAPIIRHTETGTAAASPADLAAVWNENTIYGRKNINAGAFGPQVMEVIDRMAAKYEVTRQEVVRRMSRGISADAQLSQPPTPSFLANNEAYMHGLFDDIRKQQKEVEQKKAWDVVYHFQDAFRESLPAELLEHCDYINDNRWLVNAEMSTNRYAIEFSKEVIERFGEGPEGWAAMREWALSIGEEATRSGLYAYLNENPTEISPSIVHLKTGKELCPARVVSNKKWDDLAPRSYDPSRSFVKSVEEQVIQWREPVQD